MGSSKLTKIMNDDKEFLFQNYGERLPAAFVKGDGSYLYDQDNKKYVDFLSGIAVSALGYSNAAYQKALHGQIDKIIHSSNLFLNQEQIEAARLISETSFPGKSLFVNSGTEANEAAIKLARRYGISIHRKKFKIVTFTGSFHGRTFGSMSATAQSKIHAGFGPIVPGFIYAPYNDKKAIRKILKRDKHIAAVMLELIQGESGINVADADFVKEIFETCNQKGILTIIDEVQTGIGRTGQTYAHQHYNVTPDILTLAKGLGGGIPIGAIHAKNFLSEHFPQGSHGTTFGGNHLACAAASAVLNEVKKKQFVSAVNASSLYMFDRLKKIKQKTGYIKSLRGMGLHIGVEIAEEGKPLVKEALNEKLIINCVAGNVIRIMPPLNISMKTLEEGMDIFEKLILKNGESYENTPHKQ
ncbi:MAG TPA: aspartate aminotransferase family protein [Spirochaetota bacterium]|nr:aspartate aminotransferase family protein [Spirochaetota bacterium]HPS86705.1 aspartate aminotransferase family protein [Spirochaetota bacterium]